MRSSRFNLNDVLEKVSDLLLEAGAIPQSIRQVRRDGFRERQSARGWTPRSAAWRDPQHGNVRDP